MSLNTKCPSQLYSVADVLFSSIPPLRGNTYIVVLDPVAAHIELIQRDYIRWIVGMVSYVPNRISSR